MADLITMLSAVAGQQGEGVDEDFNQTVLLLHGDGTNGAQNNTFLDSSTNNFTITRNGNTTQGTFSPFSLAEGEWSNYFDGSGDRLRIAANAAFSFGTGDFTVEYWANFNVTTAGTMVDTRSSGTSTSGYSDYLNASSQFNLFIGNTTVYTSPTTLSRGVWYHIAVARQGTTMRIFINGALDGSITNSTNFSNTNLTIGDNVQDVSSVNGYLSNVRIVKGTAVYTAAFSVPTTPLTNITNTSILTCQSNRFVDNSTNAFSVPVTGNVRVTPFSPFAPTAAYSAGTNGGSGYFDGSGDYLTLPSGAAFQFNTGDFCVEVWFYPTATLGSGYIIDARNSGQTGTWSLAFGYGGTSGQLNWGFNGSVVANGGTTNVIQNAWNHIVYSRSGTSGGLFVNGIRVANPTDSNNYNVAPTTSYIAVRYSADSPNFITGYLVTRVVKGSFVYDPTQTTLTVPTAPPTAITNTSLLLNFTNAGIIDNTGKNNLETVGDAQIDTTTKKYGTGSLEFDGTGDWLLMPSTPDLNLGTGNATIECWLYITAAIQDYRMIVSENTTLNYVCFRGGGTGGRIEINVAGTAFTINLNNSISQNTWHHLAVVRSGSTFTAYVDGSSLGTGTSSAAWNYSTNGTLVGRFGGATAYEWPGFIDDLRITKGVARYTSNFTAPTKAFPDQ